MFQKTVFLSIVLFCASASAEDVRYVTDKQLVPLRSGPGSEYRIVHRGIPSGTRLSVEETDASGDYARIVTARGTAGWIRKQYLVSDIPAAIRLAEFAEQNTSLLQKQGELTRQLQELQQENDVLTQQLRGKQESLTSTSSELVQLQRLSANTIALDQENQELRQATEMLRSRVKIADAENQRLAESGENQAFFNGALAVLLGVIITLLVPRLWPSPRRSSSWA